MKKPIGIAVSDLGGGGIARVNLNLAAGLAAAGHRVDLLLFSAKGIHLPEIPDSLRVFTLNTRIWRSHRRRLRRIPPSVKVRHLGPRRSGRMVSYFRVLAALRRRSRPTNYVTPMLANAALSIAQYIRLETPRVLLASSVSAQASAVLGRNLAGANVRVAAWSHGFVHALSGKTPEMHRRMMDFVNRDADMVVAISRGEVGELTKHNTVPRSKIVMIHSPVMTPGLPALAAQKPQHPWLANNALSVVIAAGRLSPVKDFPTLLRAFARLADKKLRLVVVGEGGERAALERLASELDITEYVDFPGWIANPFALMARARLFVLSSIWEGLPTALIESVACGCPVVSTDCPHGPREILEDGKWGALVPVGDDAALAAAMETALSQNPDRAALKRRAEFFSVERAVREYEKIVLQD